VNSNVPWTLFIRQRKEILPTLSSYMQEIKHCGHGHELFLIILSSHHDMPNAASELTVMAFMVITPFSRRSLAVSPPFFLAASIKGVHPCCTHHHQRTQKSLMHYNICTTYLCFYVDIRPILQIQLDEPHHTVVTSPYQWSPPTQLQCWKEKINFVICHYNDMDSLH